MNVVSFAPFISKDLMLVITVEGIVHLVLVFASASDAFMENKLHRNKRPDPLTQFMSGVGGLRHKSLTKHTELA